MHYGWICCHPRFPLRRGACTFFSDPMWWRHYWRLSVPRVHSTDVWLLCAGCCFYSLTFLVARSPSRFFPLSAYFTPHFRAFPYVAATSFSLFFSALVMLALSSRVLCFNFFLFPSCWCFYQISFVVFCCFARSSFLWGFRFCYLSFLFSTSFFFMFLVEPTLSFIRGVLSSFFLLWLGSALVLCLCITCFWSFRAGFFFFFSLLAAAVLCSLCCFVSLLWFFHSPGDSFCCLFALILRLYPFVCCLFFAFCVVCVCFLLVCVC